MVEKKGEIAMKPFLERAIAGRCRELPKKERKNKSEQGKEEIYI